MKPAAIAMWAISAVLLTAGGCDSSSDVADRRIQQCLELGGSYKYDGQEAQIECDLP